MNTNFHKHILNLFFGAFALIVLSACGGSGGGGSTQLGGDQSPGDVDPTYVIRAPYNAPDKAATENADRTRYTTVVDGSTIAQAVTAIKADAEYQAMGSANQIGAAYAYARGHTGEGVIISNMGDRVELNVNDVSGGSKVFNGYRASDLSATVLSGNCSRLLGSDVNSCLNEQDTHLVGIMVGKSGDSIDGASQGIAYDAKFKPVNIVVGNVFQADTADKRTKLNAAILEATQVNKADCDTATMMSADTGDNCNVITVMNNGWDKSTLAGSYQEYKYKTPAPLGTATINAAERAVWTTAVATTVVVFAQGDNGYNSENGMVKLYNADGTEAQELGTDGVTMVDKRVAWKDIAGGGGNLGTAHARLASMETATLGGKWLSVIALEDINPAPDVEELRIADFSNGCGDAKAYCLGAPGVEITSSSVALVAVAALEADRKTGTFSGTAQAAAHVSGAVAVLKSAFTHLEPDELVEVILVTADDLGIAGVDEIYGYGALNLARAVEPIGPRTICLPSYTMTTGQTMMDDTGCENKALATGITLDNSGITLPTSFGGALNGFTVGFIDDYNRAYIGKPDTNHP